MKKIEYRPIGIIHSPYTKRTKTPVQPRYSDGAIGNVEIFDQYTKGLKNLDEVSHILLIFHLDQIVTKKLEVIPHFGTTSKGVFVTRSPSRPNPIGVSIVKLEKIEGNVLTVKGIDALDGTPLLDIKPYIEELTP